MSVKYTLEKSRGELNCFSCQKIQGAAKNTPTPKMLTKRTFPVVFRVHLGQSELLDLKDRWEIRDQRVFRDRKETRVTVERMDQGGQKVIG